MSDLTLFDSDQMSPFDSIRQIDEHDAEFWSARDLMPLLGYDKWERFADAVGRAKLTAANQGADVEGNFPGAGKVSGSRGPAQQDYHLSRFAAYLTAMNGDPRKPEVAAAQAYFAIRTREAEVAPARELSGAELMARAVIEAQQMLAAKDRELEVARPKAEAFDSFLSATGDLSVRDAAHAVSRKTASIVGERRLRGLLEQWRWIYRDSRGKPRAYQTQIDLGRLAEKSQFHFHPETGERIVDTPQVRVTAKGLDAIRTRLTQEATA